MEGCIAVLLGLPIVAICLYFIITIIREWAADGGSIREFGSPRAGEALSRPSPALAASAGVSLRGSVLGRTYEVLRNDLCSRIVVDLRGRSPGMLKIAPPGPARRIAQMFGDQDIVIGDREFDDRFIVMATPESLAHRVFSPERRGRLVAAVRRVGVMWSPFVDVTTEQLIVGVVGGPGWSHPVREMVTAAREFTEALLEIGAATGIVWLERPQAEIGICQVCGTEMRERIVYCAKCKTAHHEECWRYTGECSTYACQETSYVMDGSIVRMREGRQTPDQWLHEEIVRDQIETGGGLRAPIGAFPPIEESLRRFEQRQRERRR